MYLSRQEEHQELRIECPTVTQKSLLTWEHCAACWPLPHSCQQRNTYTHTHTMTSGQLQPPTISEKENESLPCYWGNLSCSKHANVYQTQSKLIGFMAEHTHTCTHTCLMSRQCAPPSDAVTHGSYVCPQKRHISVPLFSRGSWL